MLALKYQKQLSEYRQNNLLAAASPAARPGPRPEVRYDWSIGGNLDLYWRNIPSVPGQALAILSGMSQMYAINERQPGDETIAERMDDMLAAQGIRIFGLAAPNLCNEEALLLLLATISELKAKPQAFIYGVCFDNFRNLGFAPGISGFS